ncbi:hypothetical protein LSH36_1007g01009 [Paralvinella palmiformis]|uniref:Sulfotransferase domain-containing protein n=1 Tax=Paralvinella palmiformis TaxID=53620 RepID=A0AAD9IX81_9ANNE|nr:hypothetical protein LSH36_1007g01009 [Paralvinella palmiformis]
MREEESHKICAISNDLRAVKDDVERLKVENQYLQQSNKTLIDKVNQIECYSNLIFFKIEENEQPLEAKIQTIISELGEPDSAKIIFQTIHGMGKPDLPEDYNNERGLLMPVLKAARAPGPKLRINNTTFTTMEQFIQQSKVEVVGHDVTAAGIRSHQNPRVIKQMVGTRLLNESVYERGQVMLKKEKLIGSRDDTEIEYGSNDPRSVRADHPYRHGKEKSRRVLLPHQDPLRWRNEPEEIQGSFAVDNIEYGVNVVPSITKSIEGDVWHQLKRYKNPCWVERMPLEPSVMVNSPEMIRARFEQIRTGSKRSMRNKRTRYKDEPGVQQSKMNNYMINSTSVKIQMDMDYQLTLYDRVKSDNPWKMRCLPYAYLIGVTKSGTSDFYRYLTLHQDVAEARMKEIHYWNVKRFPRMTYLYGREVRDVITFDSYLNYFDLAAHQINISVVKVNNSEWHPKITVDGSVSMFWEDAGWNQVPGNGRLPAPIYTTARTLAHFQPKARIILLLREPVERVYSYYRMFAVSKHKSNPEAFHNETVQVLRMYEQCLHFRTLRECAYDVEIERTSFSINIRSSLYSAFMPDWLRVFPRDQIHVIRSEDYFANRKPVLDDVVEFLGLARSYDGYRLYGVIGLAVLVSLSAFSYLLGLLSGVSGYKNNVIPTERGGCYNRGGCCLLCGVFWSFLFSFVLMLITIIMFLLGGGLEKICESVIDTSIFTEDMDLDSLVITQTWLTGNVLDQKFVGDVTPAGYSFHHAARIHKKGGGVGILLRDSLKCETHLRFQAKLFGK